MDPSYTISRSRVTTPSCGFWEALHCCVLASIFHKWQFRRGIATEEHGPLSEDGLALGVSPHIRKRAAADLDELRQRDAKNRVTGTPSGVNIAVALE